MTNGTIVRAAEQVMQRVARWRSVFSWWQLGRRELSDPEHQAVMHHREQTIYLRVEVSALSNLLERKGVCTAEEFYRQVVAEAEALDQQLEKRFPGFHVTDDGVVMDPRSTDTIKAWR